MGGGQGRFADDRGEPAVRLRVQFRQALFGEGGDPAATFAVRQLLAGGVGSGPGRLAGGDRPADRGLAGGRIGLAERRQEDGLAHHIEIADLAGLPRLCLERRQPPPASMVLRVMPARRRSSLAVSK